MNGPVTTTFGVAKTQLNISDLPPDHAEDIPLACCVCKEIFITCGEFAKAKMVAPKNLFKHSVMAGEGGKEVKEWEDARVHMTKIQRATRKRVVSQEEASVDAFLKSKLVVKSLRKYSLSDLMY